ncbi:hypothetical protein ACFSVJ_11735 [Prauserella oleivorans]
MPDLDSGPPTTITSPAPPTVTHHRVQEPSAGDQDLAEPLPARQHAESWQPAESQQPEEDHEAPAPAGFDEDDAGPPTQISAAPPVDPALDDLQDKLDELGVPESAYRLGEPAERGWSIERVAEGWRVGWYDAGLKSPRCSATSPTPRRSCWARCCSPRTVWVRCRPAPRTGTGRTSRRSHPRLPRRRPGR